MNAAELLRAYAELSFAGPFGGTQRIQAGRITMDVGSRRLVARNRFRNTSNAFTGVDWRWRNDDGREFRAFYTLPIKRLPDETDRLRDNDVILDEETFDFQFWGLFYSDTLPWGDTGELYVFGMHEDDLLDAISGSPPTRNRNLITPGFRLLRKPEKGHFDYQIETALQFGESQLSAATTRDLDHFAHFHHAQLGYTFACAWSPRLAFQYDYASGDDDPRDRDNGRFDTLFGARRWEYGPTSIYGAFARSNINTPGVRLQLKPATNWRALVAYRAFWLASYRDAWTTTGVQDSTGDSGSFVGSQIEFRVRWYPLRDNLRLEVGYAHLFAGEFIDDAPNSNRQGDSNYFYSQVNVNF